MIQQPHIANDFKERLRGSMQSEMLNFTTIHVSRHENVYILGEQAKMVYFIESGQIKLRMLSPDGKECLLGIHTTGDTFGELCLVGSSLRQETATAMEDSTLRGIPCARFFMHLGHYSLVEGFVQYLAVRVAGQYQKRRGYTENIGVGRDQDDLNSRALRVSVLIQPGPAFRNTTILEYYHRWLARRDHA